MITSLASVVAGLGLFFAGVWFLTQNLKRFTSRRFRQGVINWTRTPAMGFGLGALAGAFTQSMSATVFILVGLLQAGFIGVKGAFSIIAGANVGLSVLVFLATLETQLVMLFVIGLAGVALSLDLPARARPAIGALFGLSMLFLGIDLIQSGAVPLLEHEWVSGVLVWARESYMMGFALGVVLTFVSQSSTAMSILAITLADAGAFSLEQTIMIIYGTNLGSSAITLALSWNLRGRPLQIALFQVIFNIVPCLILVPLFYLEIYAGVPLVKALVVSLASDTGLQMACVYLVFQATGALVLMPALEPTHRLLERLCPATRAEDESKPRFIHDGAHHDPETALDLALREQRREIELLGSYMRNLRPETAAREGSISSRHEAFKALSAQVMEYLEDLGGKDPSYATFDRLSQLLSHQRMIQLTERSLWQLATTIESIGPQSSLRPLAMTVVAALGSVLDTVNGAIAEGGDVEWWADHAIDSRTGEVLQRIRRDFLTHDAELDPEERPVFFKITNLCERFFWLQSHLPIDELSRIDAPQS